MARFTKTVPEVPATDTSAAALATATPAAATAAVQYGNMSEAEIDAAIAAAVVGIAAATDAKGSATRLASENLVKASGNLMMLVGRKYQINPATKGEDIAVMVDGADTVKKWTANSKSARFSEYDAIGEAATKCKDRFSPDLFALAGGKEKFIKLCRELVKDATLDAVKLKELADTKPEQTDGDHIEAMIRLAGKLSTKNYPHVHDVAMFLKELRDDKGTNGLYTGAELRKLAAKGTPATTTGEPPKLTAREKIEAYAREVAAREQAAAAAATKQ